MSELLSWWNLVFLIPLGLSVLLILMNAIGLSGDSDADVEHDVHVAADAELDHEMDTHADLEHDSDVATDGDQETEHSTSSRVGVIEFLGGGRIPVTLIFQIFFLLWGVSGWILNVLLGTILPPWIFVWISITGALLIAALFTRMTAKLIWRYAPLTETYAKHREDLIGREGEAIYAITQDSGMAQIYDERGSLHRIYCRIETGAREIPGGEKVLIVHYDEDDDVYLVQSSALAIRSSNEQELSR